MCGLVTNTVVVKIAREKITDSPLVFFIEKAAKLLREKKKSFMLHA